MNQRTNVTIRDVAKAADVSVSTVSRVLNDKDDVAPETHARVKRVIEELGYTSSLAARSMRSRSTRVIGLVMHDLRHPFSIHVTRGVSQAAAALGYDLITYTSGRSEGDTWAERERRYVALLNGSIADGIIVVTPRATSFPTAYPIVAVDPHSQGADYPAVIATNRAGALEATRYLIELGHRRIGFIGGPPSLKSALLRLEGYQDALRQAGIPIDPAFVQNGDYSQETGFARAQQLLDLPTPPSAIFAASDLSAIGAIRAAREAGLEVPRDLSVVGFDDIPEATYVDPALTTVDQSIEAMGRAATEMLIDLIQGQPLASSLCEIPTRLVVRGSCQPPHPSRER